MIKLNIHEAKTHLSKYLKQLSKGDKIIICKRNIPIAEIRPILSKRRSKRPVGLAKGKFKVTKKFFEPLPDDIIDSFYGNDS